MTCCYCDSKLAYNGLCPSCDRPDFGWTDFERDSVYADGEVLHHIAELEKTKVLADFRPFEVE